MRAWAIARRASHLAFCTLLTATMMCAQTARQAAAGGNVSAYVLDDGSLWTMGQNYAGAIGDGTKTDRYTPFLAATDVAQVEIGSFFTLFIKTDGSLWGTGANFKGQLTNRTGHFLGELSPVQIETDVRSVAAGDNHTAFIKNDGSLWTVGFNDDGQLGNNSVETTVVPTQIATAVTAVTTGMFHTLFIKADGTLWAMGKNGYGQLGDGSTMPRKQPVQVASDVAFVDAGADHTLFVKNDGTLWGMGSNLYGELGSTTDSMAQTSPVQIASNVVSAATGFYFSVFLKRDGTLWGMGYNSPDASPMGDSIDTQWEAPRLIARNVRSVSAGFSHVLFLTTDGTVVAMSSNRYGELGLPPAAIAQPHGPIQLLPAPDPTDSARTGPGITEFVEGRNVTSSPITVDPFLVIAAPAVRSAKVSISGNLRPAEDELGFKNPGVGMGDIGARYSRSSGVLTLVSPSGSATRPEWQAALRAVTYFNASQQPDPRPRAIAFVINDGNSNSAPATKTIAVASANDAPHDITLASHIVHPAGGMNATIGTLSASDADGTSFTYSLVSGEGSTDNAWFNVSGTALRTGNPAALAPGSYSIRLQADDGQGGVYSKAIPLRVSSASDRVVAQAAAGDFNSRFVTTDGTLWSVGLAISDFPTRTAQKISSVAITSDDHLAVVKEDTTLWVAGYNNFGRPADGAMSQVESDVAEVAVGGTIYWSLPWGEMVWDYHHTHFIKTDKSLWSVGMNQHGQLGDGTTTNRSLPVRIASDVRAVAAGERHTLFITSDGKLWAVGYNGNGQLGDGTTTDRATPVVIASDVTAISASMYRSAFVKADGTLWTMGAPDWETTRRTTPEMLATDVASVSLGRNHAAYVTSGGMLWTWGSNSNGQLGDGTTVDRPAPVSVASGVASVSVGYNHTVFTRRNGSIWTMGSNGSGQLGDGTEVDRKNPVQLMNIAQVTAQPTSHAVSEGQGVTLLARGTSTVPLTYQWNKNGSPILNAVESSLALPGVTSQETGLYSAIIANGGAATEMAIVGLLSDQKIIGWAEEVQADIYVPANGNTYDQILLEGPAATITADHALNQIARISFVDLTHDIVQVELSGPGALSLVVDGVSYGQPATYYNQTIPYIHGHAGIVIAGATEQTNVSVFTVGRRTAIDQSLFKDDVVYDGIADIAFIAILSANGKFGGLRTANANYWATSGLTGLYAPEVEFTGPVFIGDVNASGSAIPAIVVGSSRDTRITGGDLLQPNSTPVKVSGLTQLKFTAGQNSHGNDLPARTNRAILHENGVDVTTSIVVNP